MRSFSCIALGGLILSTFGAAPASSQQLSAEDEQIAVLKQLYKEDSQADRPYRSFAQTASEELFQFHPSYAYPEKWKHVEDWILDQLPHYTRPILPEPPDNSIKVVWLKVCGSWSTTLSLDDEAPDSYSGTYVDFALLERARLEVAFEANEIPISLLSDFSRKPGRKARPDPQIRKLNERLQTWRRSAGSRDRWLVLEPWCGPAAKPDLARLPPPFQDMPEAPVEPLQNNYSLPQYFVPQPPQASALTYLAPRWQARSCAARKNSLTDISCSGWQEALPGSAVPIAKPGWYRCVSVSGNTRSWGDTRISELHIFSHGDEPKPPVKLTCRQP